MKKQFSALVLCVALLLSVLTACNGETTNTTTTTADGTTTTTTTTKFSGTTMTFAKGPTTKAPTTTKPKPTKPKPTEVNGVKVPQVAYDEGAVKLAFQDEFDSMATFDFTGQGQPGKNWYIDFPYDPSSATTKDYTVSNGVLSIKPVTTQTVSFGSYGRKAKTGYTWKFGYAETRMRFPVKNIPPLGSSSRVMWPSFWSIGITDYTGAKWPVSNLGVGYTESAELDMFEAWQLTDGTIVFSGTLHHHVKKPDGGVLNGANANAMGNRKDTYILDEEWHTYSTLWKPGYVAWYMDGEFMHSVEYAKDKLPTYFGRYNKEPYLAPASDSTWEGVFSNLETEEMVVIIGGGDKLWPVEVDFVRIWEFED